MFNKIKQAMNSAETVEELNTAISASKTEIQIMNKDISSLRQDFNDLKLTVSQNLEEIKKNHDEFIGFLNSNLSGYKEFNEKFDGHIEDLRIQKQKMLDVIYEKTTENLNKEIDRLKLDVTRYNELKDSIKNLSLELNNVQDHMQKFQQISNSIKQQDFELVKFTNKVAEIEKEKNELLRKIDTLQRLISRQRRSS